MAHDLRCQPFRDRRGSQSDSRRAEAGYSLSLSDHVQFVRGVGPVRAQEFAALGVTNVGDLLEFFPSRHELRPKSVPIGRLKADEVATVVGTLQAVRKRRSAAGETWIANIVDGTGSCSARWFHSPYLSEQLHDGLVVRATGKVAVYGYRASFTNPKFEIVEAGDAPLRCDADLFEPVYPATARLPSRLIRSAVFHVLEPGAQLIQEFLPESLRRQRNLPPRGTAILRFHRPTRLEDVEVARRRFSYEELLFCQIGVQQARIRQESTPMAKPVVITEAMDQRIRARFPFPLTPGQDAVITEIAADLSRTTPMNRLLQADVGAGKTAVALYAALAAVANRRQVAILAPTEVLAQQHQETIERYLVGSKVRRGFLSGSTSKAQRSLLLRGLSERNIDLVVGTHALLEDKVIFADLGLVIIDEQHKFGVGQRTSLRAKGHAPHVLVLTATPIPRTLAMTAFGDLDVSVLRGILPGRKPVATRVVAPSQSAAAWDFVRARLAKSEQAYVIYPLVEQSEKSPLKAATAEFEALGQTVLAGYSLDLLHGRMSQTDKSAVMARFAQRRIQVLVATTVVEVGVDIPNATVILVQHANRYGLGQLHQLRGRVGRSNKKSYCLLMSESEDVEASARLAVLAQTQDGFRIAEEDLRIRGPGELLGTRQHGMPFFRVADLRRDLEVLEQAREDAAAMLRADRHLEAPQHRALANAMAQRRPSGRTIES